MDPDDRVLLTGKNERQGDYIFTANKVKSADLPMNRNHPDTGETLRSMVRRDSRDID